MIRTELRLDPRRLSDPLWLSHPAAQVLVPVPQEPARPSAGIPVADSLPRTERLPEGGESVTALALGKVFGTLGLSQESRGPLNDDLDTVVVLDDAL
jgi:hypothetical protein